MLIALNASTGTLLWKFNTVLASDLGVRSAGSRFGRGLGDAARQRRRIRDVRNRKSVPDARFGDGAPLNAALYRQRCEPRRGERKLRWYYQAVPNDFKDYDMQASPISARIGHVPVDIGGGKMGYVYAMNAGATEAELENAGR